MRSSTGRSADTVVVIERETTDELKVFGAEEDDDVCMVLPAAFEGHPEGLVTYGGTPLQLEENEDDTSTLSAVQLFADGSVTLNDTDGPIATSVCGLWNAGGNDFQMTLRRTFPLSADSTDTYSVTRVFTGEYDEITKSYQGKIELAQTAFQDPTDEVGPFEWKYTYIGCELARSRGLSVIPFDARARGLHLMIAEGWGARVGWVGCGPSRTAPLRGFRLALPRVTVMARILKIRPAGGRGGPGGGRLAHVD